MNDDDENDDIVKGKLLVFSSRHAMDRNKSQAFSSIDSHGKSHEGKFGLERINARSGVGIQA